jgi:hypothetical protein
MQPKVFSTAIWTSIAQWLYTNISESLYSETKIAMFNHEIEANVSKMGDLPLGGSDT